MIFYNPQLMADENQVSVFTVSTPEQISSYDQHLLYIEERLKDLVLKAYDEKENPMHLLEDYLTLDYDQCCESPEQMTTFIFSHNAMTSAKNTLFENWQQYDQATVKLPSKISTTQAFNIFLETDLRRFLEALTNLHGI